MNPPWLLVAFAGGFVLGGAVTIALLVTLLSELPLSLDTRESDDADEWKY